MFSINSASHSYAASALPLSIKNIKLSHPEKQHLSYLHSITSGDNVSHPIHNINEAFNEITSRYGEEFIHNVTQLDISNEVESFNRLSAYKKINFIDWFAFRDFKMNGYVEMNRFLRTPQNNQINKPANLFQMNLSLMNLTMLQSTNPFYEKTLFRGEVRPYSSTLNWTERSTFTTESFMSSSQNNYIAKSFCSGKKSLNNDSINVFFKITYDNPLSGACISDVLHNGEDEFLFPPKTKFLITGRVYDKNKKTLTLDMSTCYSSENDFNAKLHALVLSEN